MRKLSFIDEIRLEMLSDKVDEVWAKRKTPEFHSAALELQVMEVEYFPDLTSSEIDDLIAEFNDMKSMSLLFGKKE